MKRKLVEDILRDLVFDKWGTDKTIKVIGTTIVGAGVGALIGCMLIESENRNNVLEGDV